MATKIFEDAEQCGYVLKAIIARMNLISQRQARSAPDSKSDKAAQREYDSLSSFKSEIMHGKLN